ncbi:hypothetical protein AURDEDRAFT_178560 [Auricularia subglabra TFB-10046 SS5]|uniref:Uncharacterized protein n=1 Tax=Auricularia subglabra (strain TFB-10046 / SS5) TaxID=717982 RepID=J0WKT0_AURST|nr:hypothetical protein AURDEDRAFT_178560 [Auricularia subglabra TFB-10046 SS5]
MHPMALAAQAALPFLSFTFPAHTVPSATVGQQGDLEANLNHPHVLPVVPEVMISRLRPMMSSIGKGIWHSLNYQPFAGRRDLPLWFITVSMVLYVAFAVFVTVFDWIGLLRGLSTLARAAIIIASIVVCFLCVTGMLLANSARPARYDANSPELAAFIRRFSKHPLYHLWYIGRMAVLFAVTTVCGAVFDWIDWIGALPTGARPAVITISFLLSGVSAFILNEHLTSYRLALPYKCPS